MRASITCSRSSYIPAGTPKANPTIANTWTWFSWGDSLYNALQIDVNRRFSNGLSFGGVYTCAVPSRNFQPAGSRKFQHPNLIVFMPSGLSGTAGAITATSTTARQVQFGLKLIW
jgi:hypothetical protein